MNTQVNQETAQELRIKDTGVVDGDKGFHADSFRLRRRFVLLVEFKFFRYLSDFSRRSPGLLEHLFPVRKQSVGRDATMLPHHPARQLPALDELDDEGPRHVQELGG